MSEDNREKATLEDPSTETETAGGEQPGGETGGSQTQPERKPTETEIAFNSLSGAAQERFQALIREKKDLEEKLARRAQDDANRFGGTQTPQNDGTADEVLIAARKLREQGGMATQEDINNLYWTMRNEQVHSRLEDEYDGADGKPRYVREEVEDYARRHGMGNNFKAAYRDMYFDELVDAQRQATRKRTTTTEKPTATAGREQPLTLESFRKKLREEPTYYDKLVSEGKLEATIKALTEQE